MHSKQLAGDRAKGPLVTLKKTQPLRFTILCIGTRPVHPTLVLGNPRVHRVTQSLCMGTKGCKKVLLYCFTYCHAEQEKSVRALHAIATQSKKDHVVVARDRDRDASHGHGSRKTG